MPLYDFQERFAPKVESGEKQQTIRAKRKNPPKIGQIAYCKVGLRTKNCRHLGQWWIKAVYDIVIHRGVLILDGREISGNPSLDYMDAFAVMDGFDCWGYVDLGRGNTLLQFFEPRGLPFHGDLIMWDYR